MRSRITLVLIAGGLPLLVYPAVVIASIMGLAAPRTGHEPALEIGIANSFYIGTIAYPLIYVACALIAIVMRQNGARAFKIGTVPLAFLAMLGVLFVVLVKVEPEDSDPKVKEPILMFGDVTYVHRWSNAGQHEFTPLGQEDIERWSDMVTIQRYLGVKDDEGLKSMANAVVDSYRRSGATVLRNDSVPPTGKNPAEHLIVLLLPAPGITEAIFARFKMDRGIGASVTYSHRVYGQKVEGQMSAWLEARLSSTEKSLKGLQQIPSLSLE
jgi:hypothetical protein